MYEAARLGAVNAHAVTDTVAVLNSATGQRPLLEESTVSLAVVPGRPELRSLSVWDDGTAMFTRVEMTKAQAEELARRLRRFALSDD
jgi:hypothetical protein